MSVCLSAAPLPVTPALAWLDAAEAAMDVPEHSVIDPVLTRQGLARIERFKARVAAREAHLIRIVDASTVPKDSEATSTGSLISHDSVGISRLRPVRCGPRTTCGSPFSRRRRWRPSINTTSSADHAGATSNGSSTGAGKPTTDGDREPRCPDLSCHRTNSRPKAGNQSNTITRSPLWITRASECSRTAFDSVCDSMSRPAAARSDGVMRWSTGVTACAMIGPSSSSGVT